MSRSGRFRCRSALSRRRWTNTLRWTCHRSILCGLIWSYLQFFVDKIDDFYYKPHLLRYSRTYPICWLRRQWGRHSLDERRTWRQFQGSIHGADIKVGLSFLRICSLARCRDTVWRSQISDPRPRYFESRVWSISRLCWFRTPLRPDFTKNVVFFTIPWYLIHHPFYAGYCRIRISKIGYDYGKIHGDCTNHVVDVRIGSQPPHFPMIAGRIMVESESPSLQWLVKSHGIDHDNYDMIISWDCPTYNPPTMRIRFSMSPWYSHGLLVIPLCSMVKTP